MDDYLKLTWRLHMNNFKDVIKDLQETECLSDVTLFCNDDTKIKAHKFVLIGSSSVLRTMLLQSSQKETIVFLRGVDRRELQWVLEFMYLGQTQVPQTKLQSFIELAKDLKMKGIHNEDDEKNVEDKVFQPILPINNYEMACEERNMDKQIEKDINREKLLKVKLKNIETPDSENGQQSFKLGSVEMAWEDEDKNMDRQIGKGVIHDNQEEELLKLKFRYIEKEATHDIQEEKGENIEIPDLENGSELGVRSPIFQCGSCNYQSTNKQCLKWHIEREHEGVRYPCDICPYQAKSKLNLKDHKASKHKIDPVFRCTLCDYCTNHSTGWIRHAKNKHPKFQAQEIFTETRRSDRKQWTRQQWDYFKE